MGSLNVYKLRLCFFKLAAKLAPPEVLASLMNYIQQGQVTPSASIAKKNKTHAIDSFKKSSAWPRLCVSLLRLGVLALEYFFMQKCACMYVQKQGYSVPIIV
jgi:hypothetical protein